jgi:hypothetical protein
LRFFLADNPDYFVNNNNNNKMSLFGGASNAGKADVRVDEEAKEKYQAILDLLLAGNLSLILQYPKAFTY